MNATKILWGQVLFVSAVVLAFLVNYGARRRRSEPTSTAFIESAINEIIAKRMVKK